MYIYIYIGIYVYTYMYDLLFNHLVIPLFLAQTDGRFWAAQLMEGLQEGSPGIFLGVVAWVIKKTMVYFRYEISMVHGIMGRN